QAIILGSSRPLRVYLGWNFATVGSLPVATPTGLLGKNSGEITTVIINHISTSSSYNSTISLLFAIYALATTYLGVALGLYDLK
ncbi:amino acid transporter, partial [Francisella tularensis subsp. holarctica]|uniref:aromatic amino acid transport family protein n=1 Tax=Francisella tularensis TaxID=263 RepID=UPI002381C852